MKFDDLDRLMRPYETAYDFCVPMGNHIVVRLDGRGFTRLTKDIWQFDAPFDPRFRDLMTQTVAHLMQCGFNILYGFTQSDEISLLFHPADDTFARKTRKLASVLAGEASACFTHLHGQMATFDARVCVLPGAAQVWDYFHWRQEDAHRNALNAHCYWKLRQEGASERDAAARISGLKLAEKHDLLHARGINYNDLPAWQKRGIGLYWGDIAQSGHNPQTGETTQTTRRRLITDLELPYKEDYRRFLQGMTAVAAQL